MKNGNASNGNGRVNGNGHMSGNGNGHFQGIKVTAFDYLIVGAGYAGSVLAERLARGSGRCAGHNNADDDGEDRGEVV